jgi:hypothetical protein
MLHLTFECEWKDVCVVTFGTSFEPKKSMYNC